MRLQTMDVAAKMRLKFKIGDEQKRKKGQEKKSVCTHGVQNRPPLKKFLDPPLIPRSLFAYLAERGMGQP